MIRGETYYKISLRKCIFNHFINVQFNWDSLCTCFLPDTFCSVALPYFSPLRLLLFLFLLNLFIYLLYEVTGWSTDRLAHYFDDEAFEFKVAGSIPFTVCCEDLFSTLKGMLFRQRGRWRVKPCLSNVGESKSTPRERERGEWVLPGTPALFQCQE